MYIDRPLREYLDDLAARKPAPGGGSAAALTASIGAALMSMVANYTLGNPKYKAVEGRASDILKKAGAARIRLQELVGEDIEAYGRLSKGMKEHKADEAKLQDIYKEAIAPPLEVCAITADCLKLCDELAGCGNKGLITDTAIAAILLEGAFFSAKYNVYINLKYIKDLNFIEKTHETLHPLEDAMSKLKEEILEKCEAVITE